MPGNKLSDRSWRRRRCGSSPSLYSRFSFLSRTSASNRELTFFPPPARDVLLPLCSCWLGSTVLRGWIGIRNAYQDDGRALYCMICIYCIWHRCWIRENITEISYRASKEISSFFSIIRDYYLSRIYISELSLIYQSNILIMRN